MLAQMQVLLVRHPTILLLELRVWQVLLKKQREAMMHLQQVLLWQRQWCCEVWWCYECY